MSVSGNECETTLFQSQLVRLRSDVLSDAKDDIVTVPIYIPQGPDWEYLKPSQFMVDYADVMITPYYEETSMVNKIASEEGGVVTGNFPVYINVYAGNTMGEEKDPQEATKMNQMLYSGVYMTGTQTSTSKVELRGTVFKTEFGSDGKIEDKDSIFHKWIDNQLLDNDKIALQLCRVAISLRKSDFHVSASSEHQNGMSATFRKLREIDRKEQGKAEKKVAKGKKGEPEQVETIDEPKNGKLIADAPFYITTKVKLIYKRQPY